MITLKCKTDESVRISDLTPFQGELKKRTEKDYEKLGESLVNDGLLMPFAAWHFIDEENDKETLYLLDGHGRSQALSRLAIQDPSIIEQKFPVLLIDAKTEEDARKALLQITSKYGQYNKKAVLDFAAPVINYSSPVLDSAKKSLSKKVDNADERSLSQSKNVILRVSVPENRVKQLTELLRQVDGIEVL